VDGFERLILMRMNYSVVLLCAAAAVAAPSDRRLASPDGKIEIWLSDDGGLDYQVRLDGGALLAPSRLGLEFEGGVALGPRARIEKESRLSNDSSWEDRFGRRRVVRDHYNELRLTLSESSHTFGLIVRAYDNGVAFRYDLPVESGLGKFVLTRERTEFAFPGDYTGWVGDPNAASECQYPRRSLHTIQAGQNVLPLLVETPRAYVAIAESDLRDWAGMFITGNGSSTVTALLAPRADRHGAVVSETPRLSPWRVLMIARTPAELLGQDLIATLASPSRIADVSWIKPGISAWDAWWTGIDPYLDGPKGLTAHGSTESDKEYIDFAAEMGWPYQLADWYWYQNMSSYDAPLHHGAPEPGKPPIDFEKSMPYIDMPAIFAHARQRGVRLIVWLHSDDLNRYGVEKGLDLLGRWGAAGAKIDFLNSDSQETVAWTERVIEAAARRHLLVDFHGTYKPAGLARTWPNFITQEGVLGNEYHKINLSVTPLHTVTLPFTRGLLGPMDFTPGGFRNRTTAEFRITSPAEVIGTRARQLAEPVIYFSPLTVLCDSPANYRGQPGLEFYRGLPTVWDDSVTLSAEVGKHIVLARRSGDRWYVAAMNGDEPLTLRVPLSFLGEGTWTLRSFADGPDSARRPELVVESSRPTTAAETISIFLAPAGGFAAVLRRQ
jgi:alpha-glucosidase